MISEVQPGDCLSPNISSEDNLKESATKQLDTKFTPKSLQQYFIDNQIFPNLSCVDTDEEESTLDDPKSLRLENKSLSSETLCINNYGCPKNNAESVSISVANRSSFYSSAAKQHAQNKTLVSHQSAKIDMARMYEMVQDITKCNFGRNAPSKSDSISVAHHLAIEYGRPLTSTELMIISIKKFWFDNLELKIGDSFMHVDRYLFLYHFNAFKGNPNLYLELPSHKVPMNLMAKLYHWLIDDNYMFPLGDDFLAIYEMAKFLDLRRLLEQFWFTFSTSSSEGFWEQGAFKGYLDARQMPCPDMMSIFLTRIRKCFLPLVASIEFLQLDVNELIFLFKLDTISVNCEDEIFFTAVRWLEYDWSERKKHIIEIMNHIRFRLISPWLQRSLLYHPENQMLRELAAKDEVKALLWEACLFGTAILGAKKFPDSCDKLIMHHYNKVIEMQRFWVYCPGVPHHHDIKCTQFRPLTYETFNHFLTCLQSNSQTFMDTIRCSPQKQWVSYECCNSDRNVSCRIIPHMYKMSRKCN
ncbi:uncharacterized protein LOC132790123 [Drosophila nasuta]|uniref:uncharacterized protein LOC132790123 n=1 Tax=Drosophila nasuta TaxID=42062 RepID=UPI00295F0407|nr:uncharacterized protein LOC132790123 [Drosophila nasuta]